jgi:deoxyadenosine/deoxycytidine kinase
MQNGDRILSLSIIGNIGSGKTYLKDKIRGSSALNDLFHIVICDEPTDEWEKKAFIGGKSIIQLFYSDPAKWAEEFQKIAFESRLSSHISTMEKISAYKGVKPVLFISERSLYCDRYIFTKSLTNSTDKNGAKYIGNEFYEKYKLYFHESLRAIKYRIDYFLNMKTDSITCLDRIKRRDRNGESPITIDYLNILQMYQDKMIKKMEPNVKSFDIENSNAINFDAAFQSLENSLIWLFIESI